MPTVMDEMVTILGIDLKNDLVPKMQKFQQILGGVAKFASLATAGLMSAAGAISYFTEQSAQASASLDKFHQLTGISTASLQGLQYAAEQAGGSSAAITQDLMKLTESMDSPIPGEFNQTLFMMGINIRKSSGEIKGADEILMDFSDHIKGMSTQRQLQWASHLGISNDTLLLLQLGREEIQKLQKQAKEIPTIVDQQQLKDAREFTVQLSLLRRILIYLGQEITSAAGPALRGIVHDSTEWLKANQKLIKSGLKSFIDGVIQGFRLFREDIHDLVNIVVSLKERFFEAFPGIKKFIDGLTEASGIGSVVENLLIALGSALVVAAGGFIAVNAEAIAAGAVFLDFISYLKGGNSVIGEMIEWVEKLWEKFSKRFPAIAELLTKFANIIKTVVVTVLDDLLSKLKQVWELIKKIGDGIVWVVEQSEKALEEMGLGKEGIKKGAKNWIGGADSTVTGSQIAKKLEAMGFSKEQAAGIAGSFMQESSGNPGNHNGLFGSHYGLGQWDSSRQEDFRQWSGHDIKGSSVDEQLAFFNYEITQGKEKKAGEKIRAAKTAAEAALAHSKYYERPGFFEASNDKRVSMSTEILKAMQASPALQLIPSNNGVKNNIGSQITVQNEFNINGENPMGIASETNRKMSWVLQQMNPGAFSPIAQ